MNSETPGPAAKPVPIALVVCDNVYRDMHGKRALVGLFHRITTMSAAGPIIHPRICVYVSVTDVYPNSILEMDIIHAETDEPVVTAQTTPTPKEINPRGILDFQFVLENLTFPDEGLYYVRFKANGYTLLQRPIEVRRIKKGNPTDDDNES